jgi:hypothetical protein
MQSITRRMMMCAFLIGQYGNDVLTHSLRSIRLFTVEKRKQGIWHDEYLPGSLVKVRLYSRKKMKQILTEVIRMISIEGDRCISTDQYRVDVEVQREIIYGWRFSSILIVCIFDQ